MIETAKKVCGTNRQSNYKKQTAWWTPEIREQIKQKKGDMEELSK